MCYKKLINTYLFALEFVATQAFRLSIGISVKYTCEIFLANDPEKIEIFFSHGSPTSSYS